MNFNRLDLTTHVAVRRLSGDRIWLVVLLLLFALPVSSYAQRPDVRDPESYWKVNAEAFAETERIQKASVRELTEMLSRPEEFIRYYTSTVTGINDVSVWWTAIDVLRAKIDDARPYLKKMLSSSERSTRWNALLVLQGDDPAGLRKLKKEYLRLLDDPEVGMRTMGYRILGKIGDRMVEDLMLHDLAPLLRKLKRSSEDERKMVGYEIESIVKGLCAAPVNKEAVIRALVEILDHPQATQNLLATTISESKPLSLLVGTGDDLLAAYWRVVGDRSEYNFASAVMRAMEESDSRTMPFLMQATLLSDSNARAEVYSELMRHRDFDMEANRSMVLGMLQDSTVRARSAAVRNVKATPSQENIDAVFGDVLHLLSNESVPMVRQEGINSLLAMWRGMGNERQEQLDAGVRKGMAREMLNGMEGIYARMIMRGTGHCLGEYWGWEDVPDYRKRTVAYWEAVLGGE